MKFFKPEEFAVGMNTQEINAEFANAKLQRQCKRVYGVIGTDAWTDKPDQYKSTHLTHQALLIAIEPIEKKCEHIPQHDYFWRDNQITLHGITCSKCGKKLKARLEECE